MHAALVLDLAPAVAYPVRAGEPGHGRGAVCSRCALSQNQPRSASTGTI